MLLCALFKKTFSCPVVSVRRSCSTLRFALSRFIRDLKSTNLKSEIKNAVILDSCDQASVCGAGAVDNRRIGSCRGNLLAGTQASSHPYPTHGKTGWCRRGRTGHIRGGAAQVISRFSFTRKAQDSTEFPKAPGRGSG